MKTELESFDGKDSRREIMVLLQRLGSNLERKRFLKSLIPHSLTTFKNVPMDVQGNCDPIAAYYMMVSVCNELGVSINEAARRLERWVSRL